MIDLRRVATALFAGICPLSADQTITGRASVIDGDTIEIAGERIRFEGIDVPEDSQSCRDAAGAAYACGHDAAHALDRFLAESRPTECEPSGRDRYKRIMATCYRQDGTNVSAWLVRQGWALDWLRYSDGAYAGDQSAARARARGMWQGEFVAPWEWRRGELLGD